MINNPYRITLIRILKAHIASNLSEIKSLGQNWMSGGGILRTESHL